MYLSSHFPRYLHEFLITGQGKEHELGKYNENSSWVCCLSTTRSSSESMSIYCQNEEEMSANLPFTPSNRVDPETYASLITVFLSEALANCAISTLANDKSASVKSEPSCIAKNTDREQNKRVTFEISFAIESFLKEIT